MFHWWIYRGYGCSSYFSIFCLVTCLYFVRSMRISIIIFSRISLLSLNEFFFLSQQEKISAIWSMLERIYSRIVFLANPFNGIRLDCCCIFFFAWIFSALCFDPNQFVRIDSDVTCIYKYISIYWWEIFLVLQENWVLVLPPIVFHHIRCFDIMAKWMLKLRRQFADFAEYKRWYWKFQSFQ